MTMRRDAAFSAVREHCLSKVGVHEEYPWGEVVWKTGGRIFAIGSLGDNAFTVKASRADQEVLVHHRSVEAARYVGRFGWVTVTVTGRESLALALELIDQSYASLAPARARAARHHAPGRNHTLHTPPPGWD